MGIPRLITYLQPYATAVELGRCFSATEDIDESALCSVIVDGPGFAYHIYYRLLAWRHESCSAINAAPSYEEIGEAALLFLNELEKHNITIDKIYFDGLLPTSKEPTRLSRLESYLRQLVKYRSIHPAPFRPHKTMSLSASVDIGKLFDGFCSIPTQFSALPAPSFLVVAVIEALRHSHYGTITEVVPGEADTFCAARARSHEGIVLSNDSDLLVADLGSEGSVSLFGDLSLSAESTSESLRTNLFKPREMAAQLGLPDIRGLAFELTQDSTMSLHEAVRRAKSLTQTVDKNALYQDFIKCYEAVDSSQVESTAYARCSTNSLLLDPRVSELVLQYTDLALQTARNMKAEDEILEPKMYLPFLLDDPARSSAWVASSSLRELAYSLLSLSINDDTKPRYIAEYGRRGHRIAATTVSLYEREECKAHSMALTKRLQTARSSFGTLSIPDFSRVYGLYELCRWFRENDKPIPPQDLRKKLMGCEYQDQSLWTWDDIHLSAQLQGILYSLRIVQQITAQVTHDVEISDDWLERLHDQASTLPPVNKLFPSRHHPGNEQLPGSSWDRVIRSMSKLLDDEFTKLEHDILDDLKDGIAARSNLDYASTNTPASRQALVPSKKRRRKERVDGTATERSAPRPVNNLYSVLDRN